MTQNLKLDEQKGNEMMLRSCLRLKLRDQPVSDLLSISEEVNHAMNKGDLKGIWKTFWCSAGKQTDHR